MINRLLITWDSYSISQRQYIYIYMCVYLKMNQNIMANICCYWVFRVAFVDFVRCQQNTAKLFLAFCIWLKPVSLKIKKNSLLLREIMLISCDDTVLKSSEFWKNRYIITCWRGIHEVKKRFCCFHYSSPYFFPYP